MDKKTFKKLIKEAVREEIKDILVEAVIEASKQPGNEAPENSPTDQNNFERSHGNGNAPVSEAQLSNPAYAGQDSIQQLLNQTKQELKQSFDQSYKGSVAPQPQSQQTVPQQGPVMIEQSFGGGNAGVDLNQLPFINKAKQIYKQSNKKPF